MSRSERAVRHNDEQRRAEASATWRAGSRAGEAEMGGALVRARG